MQRWRFDLGYLFATALFGALWVAACERSPAAASALDLQRNLSVARHCQVSVPDSATLALVRATLARQSPANLVFVPTLEAQRRAPSGNEPWIWIGTPHSAGAEVARARLGIESSATGFHFLGQDFEGRCDAVIATVADPDRPQAVLELVLGNDLSAALRCVDDWTPTARLGWQSIRAGAVQAEGAIDARGAASAEHSIDLAAAEAARTVNLQRGERVDFDWIATAAFEPERDAAWLEALDRAAGQVRSRLNPITPFDAQWRLGLRIQDTPEALARSCRVRGFAHLRPLDGQDELSLVHVYGAPDNSCFEFARALALESAGAARAAWLIDGVAAASAETWFGRSKKNWLAHLSTGGLVPSVAELANGAPLLSPQQLRPLRGALLEACEELHGADFAAKMWAAPPETIPLPSDEQFQAWLTRAIGAEVELARKTRLERRSAALSRAARRGVCLVPSLPQADPFAGGFGSAACEISLAKMKKLGATAVALCWCTALESSAPRVFGAGRLAWTQADDAALFHTILAAQRRGLSVVLLPQLLATENGGWASGVMLSSRESQRTLFAEWRAFLVNLGLLAELAGVDVLSLGSEAPDTTVTREFENNRRSAADLAGLRADWGFLIEAGRNAFGGGLTYASRWDGEAQGIEFWKELDFLGQNLFVPYGEASAAEAPSTEEFTNRIVGSFAHLSQMAKESGVRGLVTGIGISSTATGWREPSRPLGALDLEIQTRFYDGLVRALQLGRRQELNPAGLFTWCWWSDPDSGGSSERGFTPQNKPAQAALGRALNVR